MNQQCKVCGEPAAGFHFGAFTCEGCKVIKKSFQFHRVLYTQFTSDEIENYNNFNLNNSTIKVRRIDESCSSLRNASQNVQLFHIVYSIKILQT